MPTRRYTKKPLHTTSHSTVALRVLGRIALTIGIIAAFLIIGSFKVGYDIDEMYTYGLSNHQFAGSIQPDIEEGTPYTGEEVLLAYTAVDEDHTFDYANVAENQKRDVHPPLYYLLVHTVCSLFPGTFSGMYALIINALLAAVVFWQIVWLFRRFIKKQSLAIIFSLLFIFTMGFVNSVVFFRMYILLTVWTNALIMLFCKYKPEENNWQFYVLLALFILGGMLTQYYFIIFAAFACIVYAIRVVLARNWKKLIISIVSVAVGLVIAYLLFPAMIKQIFGSYRGRSAFESIASGGYFDHLANYVQILNLEVFGCLFILLVCFGVILGILSYRKSRRNQNKNQNIYRVSPRTHHIDIWMYLQLIIPVVCYIIVIARIAPYDSDRYLTDIMGLLYIFVFAILINLAARLSGRVVGGVVIAAILTLVCSYQSGVPFMYLDENEHISEINSLDDPPCLFIYSERWRTIPNFIELENLDQIVFVNGDNTDLLDEEEHQNYDRLLLYVVSGYDSDEIINALIQDNPGLETSTELFTQGYATAYYLD